MASSKYSVNHDDVLDFQDIVLVETETPFVKLLPSLAKASSLIDQFNYTKSSEKPLVDLLCHDFGIDSLNRREPTQAEIGLRCRLPNEYIELHAELRHAKNLMDQMDIRSETIKYPDQAHERFLENLSRKKGFSLPNADEPMI